MNLRINVPKVADENVRHRPNSMWIAPATSWHGSATATYIHTYIHTYTHTHTQSRKYTCDIFGVDLQASFTVCACVDYSQCILQSIAIQSLYLYTQ